MKMSFRQLSRAFVCGALLVVSASLQGAIAADPNAEAVEALSHADAESLSAIRMARGNGAIFCTLGDENMVVDWTRTAVLHSREFRAWHDRGNVLRYAEVRTNLDALLFSMKNGRCNVAVERPSNIMTLAAGLKQEGMIFQVLPSPIGPAQIAELYANSLGFASNKDLQLAVHMRVNNEELQSYYKIGITSATAYDEAIARMQSQGYSQDRAELRAFLRDEAEGERRNLSAAAIREERTSRPVP